MLPLLPLAVGCAEPPGVLVGPDGIERLRTASYRVTGDGEIAILLSNDVIPCSLPEPDDDAGYASLLVAACREDARHAVLVAYDHQGRREGSFQGFSDGSGVPDRGVAGWYYAVLEASLFTVDGLDRGYLVDEDRLLPLGAGGELDLSEDGGILSGRFEFPLVSARFSAQECPGDATVLEALDTDPVAYCQRL